MITSYNQALKLHEDLEIDTLSRTIWGTAGNMGDEAMAAVASMIMNRVNSDSVKWWGQSIIEICLKPFQFGCWNKDDVRNRQCLMVNESDARFVSALRIAADAKAGAIDANNGATHFYDEFETRGRPPYWVGPHKPCAVIGTLVFYRIGG